MEEEEFFSLLLDIQVLARTLLSSDSLGGEEATADSRCSRVLIEDPTAIWSLRAALKNLHCLCKSSEVRDFRWEHKELTKECGASVVHCSLYLALWPSLCWVLGVVQLNTQKHSLECSGDNLSAAEVVDEIELLLLEVWEYLVTLPEYDHLHLMQSKEREREIVSQQLLLDLIYRVFERTAQLATSLAPQSTLSSAPPTPLRAFTNVETKIRLLQLLLHWLYSSCFDHRAMMRALFGKYLLRVYPCASVSIVSHSATLSVTSSSHDAGSSRSHVAKFLMILQCVLRGISPTVNQASEQRQVWHQLVRSVLMPLHEPNEMVEWRDQIPVIQSYHEQLVKCLLELVKKETAHILHFSTGHSTTSTILGTAILFLLRHWPDGFNTNTPKQVLFLHELELLLGQFPDSIETESTDALHGEFQLSGQKKENLLLVFHQLREAIIVPVLDRIARSVGSEVDNIRPAQRALQFFKNTKILNLLFPRYIMNDRTVKPFTVEQSLMKMLPALYRGGVLSWNPTVNKMTALAIRNIQDQCGEQMMRSACQALFDHTRNDDSTFMNGIPSKERHLDAKKKVVGSSKQESLGVVINRSERPSMLPPTSRRSSERPSTGLIPSGVKLAVPSSRFNNTDNPPPITITGVAPWAIEKPAQHRSDIMAIETQQNNLDSYSHNLNNGYDRLLRFVEKCQPSDQDNFDSQEHVWVELQAAPTPTLLPDLKFHDLVFGAELGHGAFSTVKYCRHITKGKAQTLWPEYAVKIIQASKIQELQYYSSIAREIAILTLLHHPGIARMISAFRYKDSAYLVLEFASRGDLHTLLLRNGKITVHQTRFVVGEVAAALMSIHQMGFSYGDLKPENILITELGHVKLTDFGACRAISLLAKEQLINNEHVLETLRNGDWKEVKSTPFQQKGITTQDCSVGNTTASLSERLEGTPAYLPPEVLLRVNENAGLQSDSWALGCVTFFCLNGRPLYYGDTDEVLEQMAAMEKIAEVHFSAAAVQLKEDKKIQRNHKEGNVADENDDFEDADASSFLSSLTDRDPAKRMSVEQCIRSNFLTKRGAMEPLRFHVEPPVQLPSTTESKSEVDQTNQLWSRRQFSVLWAPMPKEYDADNGNIEVQKLTGGKKQVNTAADLWLMQNSYRLLPVHETEVERGAHFSVPDAEIEAFEEKESK